MEVPKTKKKSLSPGASKNVVIWRHNDVIIEIDVIIGVLRHYDVLCMKFASASTQTFLLGHKNLGTKFMLLIKCAH